MKQRMADGEEVSGDYAESLRELAAYDGLDLAEDCAKFLMDRKTTTPQHPVYTG